MLASHLQDSWQQVGKVLQQSCVALVGQDERRRSPSSQGLDLEDDGFSDETKTGRQIQM